MKDQEALAILRAQGHAASNPDPHTGRVRVWIHGTEDAVDVSAGGELHDLAEGKVTFQEIRERREDETLAER
ncbi:MAG TPA: hypothetical protein VJ732_17540 [Bryobacteraceae bacterium]|nr:hypothetical protein [Bryobacteraceae bacterium]